MSVIRKDPLSHGWVIFAEKRYDRPDTPLPDPFRTPPDECPFCPGHEHMTPPEVAAYRAPGALRDTAGWSVRTIPNQFALLHIEGKLDKRGEGLYDLMNGVGANEVVVETPEHDSRLQRYPTGKIEEVMRMLRDRYTDLARDPRFRHIQIYRNHGAEAGSKITHPHSQIIALPIIPRWVREEINHGYEHWVQKERCIFCDIVAQDCAGPRLVYENEGFTVLTPFASKFSFETWIFPREHAHTYGALPDSLLEALADAIKMTLTALARTLGEHAYNFILHSAPLQFERAYHNARAKVPEYYHWHIEIIPRGASITGFEYGTGFYINATMPETAAESLRAAIAAERGTTA